MKNNIKKLLNEASEVIRPYNKIGWDPCFDTNSDQAELLLAIEITTEMTSMLMLNATGRDGKDLGFTANEIQEMIHEFRVISWSDDEAKKLLNEVCVFIEIFMLTYESVTKFEEL